MTRLYRSETNKKIAGVCGGIGEVMDVDPTIIRLLAIVFGLVTGIIPFTIGYLLAWWIVPVNHRDRIDTSQP
ncbi:MAG: PspC domain-containing protein [Ignavibacteria bacterium]|nr:PspC domain-containing protein [Ignavibacteria bacterium]